MADQQHVSAPGCELDRIEWAFAQLLGGLDVDPELLAGDASGLLRSDLGAGQAEVELRSQDGKRAAGFGGLALSLLGQLAGGIVAVPWLRVAVA